MVLKIRFNVDMRPDQIRQSTKEQLDVVVGHVLLGTAIIHDGFTQSLVIYQYSQLGANIGRCWLVHLVDVAQRHGRKAYVPDGICGRFYRCQRSHCHEFDHHRGCQIDGQYYAEHAGQMPNAIFVPDIWHLGVVLLLVFTQILKTMQIGTMAVIVRSVFQSTIKNQIHHGETIKTE